MLLRQHRAPVRLTRRSTESGEPVVLDLEAAGLPFGAGPRACPGQAQALALAAAVVMTVRELAEVIEDKANFQRSPNLRIPARVRVRLAGR